VGNSEEGKKVKASEPQNYPIAGAALRIVRSRYEMRLAAFWHERLLYMGFKRFILQVKN
jgi:hypothetical protein